MIAKLLCVENHRFALEIYRATLSRREGVQTEYASKLSEAVEILRKDNRFDAILVDLSLEDSGGTETIKRIVELTEAPVIVYSGTSITPEECVEAGATRVFYKAKDEFNDVLRATAHIIAQQHPEILWESLPVWERKLKGQGQPSKFPIKEISGSLVAIIAVLADTYYQIMIAKTYEPPWWVISIICVVFGISLVQKHLDKK